MRIFLCFFIFSSVFSYGQIDAGSVLGLPNGSLANINTISSPTEGNMAYANDANKVYVFDGTLWREVMFVPKVIALTSNYTLSLSDNASILTFDSTTDVTLTVPSGLPLGFNVSLYQINTGKVTIAAGAGASVKNRLLRFRTAGLDAGVGIVCTSTDTYHVTGDLKRN